MQLSPAVTRHGNANATGALPLATDVSVGGVPADKGERAKVRAIAKRGEAGALQEALFGSRAEPELLLSDR